MSDNIEAFARGWLAAKADEERANKARISIENELVNALGARVEGAVTHDLGPYKVVITGKLTRKIDLAEWDKVKDNIPAEMHPVKVTTTVDATGCKYLANNEPDLWAKISSAFTTAPAKTSVAVKEVEQ